MLKSEIMAGVEHDHKSSRVVMNNTVRFTVNGKVHWRFYRTTVFEQTDAGFIVRTNGHHTITTENRIQRALQKDFSTNFHARRMSKGWNYAQIYLLSETQMVPIDRELEVRDGVMPERSSHFDGIFRAYWHLRWTHNWGFTTSPNDVEWDGRASTLRHMMVGNWQNRRLPWRFLNRLPGLKIEFEAETTVKWTSGSMVHVRTMRMRYVCKSHKIRMRDLFDRVLAKGNIDDI